MESHWRRWHRRWRRGLGECCCEQLARNRQLTCVYYTGFLKYSSNGMPVRNGEVSGECLCHYVAHPVIMSGEKQGDVLAVQADDDQRSLYTLRLHQKHSISAVCCKCTADCLL